MNPNSWPHTPSTCPASTPTTVPTTKLTTALRSFTRVRPPCLPTWARQYRALPSPGRHGQSVERPHNPVQEREQYDTADRYEHNQPPPGVDRVAAGPHQTPFHRADHRIAGGAQHPPQGTERRHVPGTHQPRGEGDQHAQHEDPEDGVARERSEVVHGQGRNISTRSVCANPALGPPPIT